MDWLVVEIQTAVKILKCGLGTTAARDRVVPNQLEDPVESFPVAILAEFSLQTNLNTTSSVIKMIGFQGFKGLGILCLTNSRVIRFLNFIFDVPKY